MDSRQPTGKFLLIVDYNLSRVRDVLAMREYARTRHGLGTILIRAQPTATDRRISDVVINLNPRDGDFVTQAVEALEPFRPDIVAGLVFSDNAVHAGAVLLEALGLPVDDAGLAEAALSKQVYREVERRHGAILAPQGTFIPTFRRIGTLDELVEFSLGHPDGFVIKPSCEGNNRGVILLRQGDELPAALREVSCYLSDGLICEQRIPFQREFSYDGVGHLAFITEKLSVDGRYPVEKGQMLPATLSAAEARLIRRVGAQANLLVGQRDGPFHNEIKLSDDGERAAVVEPNRRPAGMKIWSLAHKVYGIDFYQLWVDQALGLTLPEALPEPRGQAATIMLGAPFDGTLLLADRPDGEQLLRQQVVPALRERGALPPGIALEWFEFGWLHGGDREVRVVPRDNGDFLAQVCIYSAERTFDLRLLTEQIQTLWKHALAPHLRCTAAATA